ncbi:Molybdopterin-guanine dinucleotide biosynthesis protein MobB [Methanosarcina horonobensis HB-1 = JCM 15518]|uniref:Molybdopterin-guanine dinucleotide biosynthesis protein MobB n=1 Tax=Methanosarcina horonobensis HB-1 = JCM 15518 TaxID=1434110 RepID=A0A0E3S962_9EURY|nr:molybdopterin synthase [Methanosarcina horonobensis]AKB78089.1 Molybdopterin-guanine dinucleotide biosynthesis protein MobB [Methanosarcina horonobensis HB-1 = JCM 15518]
MKVISVVGYKKSGKTALVSALVRQLSGFGTVGTVKHMGEQRLNPGETDTGRHFDAGADMVIGITGTELVSFARDSDLEDALDMLCDRGLDFAVVEGFKGSNLPKIAIGDVEGVSNVVIRIPENIDPHEELTASLVGISLVQPDHYTLEALIKKARKNPDIRKAGAIGTFSGIVRELAGEEKTSRLEFEKYEPEASKVLDRIRDEIKQKEGILEVLIHHKAGVIEAGEDIVYIVIASAHRTELFPALSEAIERVKAEAPIWKKEFTEKEEFWVHDREHA